MLVLLFSIRHPSCNAACLPSRNTADGVRRTDRTANRDKMCIRDSVGAVFVMSLVFEQVVLHRELVIMVYVVADPGVDNAHHEMCIRDSP